MKFTEFLEIGCASVNKKEITLDGFFVMTRGIGYFVSDRENRDNMAQAILIEHPDLERRLLSSVPANGGSKYSYSSKARISGIFILTETAEFIGKMVNIKDFVIYIFDEPMPVRI